MATIPALDSTQVMCIANRFESPICKTLVTTSFQLKLKNCGEKDKAPENHALTFDQFANGDVLVRGFEDGAYQSGKDVFTVIRSFSQNDRYTAAHGTVLAALAYGRQPAVIAKPSGYDTDHTFVGKSIDELAPCYKANKTHNTKRVTPEQDRVVTAFFDALAHTFPRGMGIECSDRGYSVNLDNLRKAYLCKSVMEEFLRMPYAVYTVDRTFDTLAYTIEPVCHPTLGDETAAKRCKRGMETLFHTPYRVDFVKTPWNSFNYYTVTPDKTTKAAQK